MSDETCIFCKIVTGKLPGAKIYEDEVMAAFLDIGPLSPGHTLIVPKTHVERLEDCPPEILAHLAGKAGKLIQAVLRGAGYSDYNLLCNNGSSSGQVVPHVHFHIIPRRENDNVFNRWPAGRYGEGEMDRMATCIREQLG